MRKKKWLLLALLPLILTGCWDKKDPEDRTFVITLGADASPNGCVFTFAPANIETGEATIDTAESRTLAGAVAQVDTKTSRKTDLGQLKTVILGADLLRDSEKLDAFLSELERSQTVSEKVMLLATEGSAADCVAAVLAEDSETGLFLWDFYKNTAGEVAVTKGMDLDTFLTERAEQGGNGVFPRIFAAEGEVKLGGGVAVSAGRVFLLNAQEERGYLFLLGEAEGALLEGEAEGSVLPVEINRSEAQYAFSVQGQNILCRICLPLEGTLQGGEGIFLSPQAQAELEETFAAIIKKEVAHTLEIAKRAEQDLFGILPRLQQKAPELAEGISREALWNALTFEIQPEFVLKDIGRKR